MNSAAHSDKTINRGLSSPRSRVLHQNILRYGLALGSVAGASALGFLAEELDLHDSVFAVFLVAIALTSWWGGVRPGIIAFLLSAFVFNYVFSPPLYALSVRPQDIAHLLALALFSGLLIWFGLVRRQVEGELRESRDELEKKVAERTADLQKTNEQLQQEVAERRRVEEILRERASLLDLTHDTVFVRDMQDVITYWNRGAEELYGWKSHEAVGQVSHQLARTIFPAPLEEINRELLATGRWEGELIHSKRDGTQVTVASRWSLQRDEQGAPFRILETNNDITEWKQAEEAARRSEKELREVFETIPVMVWSTLPDGTVDFINRRWQEFTGFTLEKALGWNWEETVHPDDRSQLVGAWRAALKNGQAMEGEGRVRRADGEYHWWFVHNVPSRDEQGEIVKWYGAAVDIEDRKRAERAQREGEQRYRNIFEGAGVSIWEEDFSQIKAAIDELKARGVQDFRHYLAAHPEFVRQAMSMVKVVEVNEATLKLFGAESKEELVGSLERIMVAETAEGFAGELIAIAEGRSAFEGETVLQTLKGERLTVLFTITFPADRAKLDSVLVSITDISDRKRAEALQAGEKRLLEMIATGVPLPEIFNALCLIIEEQRRGTLASVLLLNPDGMHLDFVAGPSLPKRWAREMETLPVGPCAGSCGTAAYRGSAVIVSDLATDPLWDVPEHRSAALRHGLRASWSNPVLSSKGEVLGTFCMYYRETRTPTAQDLGLIELATHLIRVAIERDRAQQAVRASEQVARGQVDALMQSLDVLATAPEPDKFLGQMLLSIRRQLQASRVLLFLRSEPDDALRLRLAVEGEKQIPEDPEHPFVKDPYAWKTLGFWQEMLFTGGPIVCEEIEQEPRLGEEMRAYLRSKGTRKFLSVPVLITGQVRGFIGIHHPMRDTYRSEEIELAQALAHQVMLAIELTQLAEQGRHAAILEERTRMARDIHDTLAQGFTGVVVQMEAAEDALGDEDSEYAMQHIRRARQLARDSLGEARRSVHALRPKALENAGFWDALRSIIRNTTLGTRLHTGFRLEGDVRELAPHVEENLLHIGQEALTNALKHAHATRFETRLAFEPNAVRLELCDNGNGFVTNGENGGFGLIGMRERVEQIGGTLTITSARGEGTTIVALAPYKEKGTT